jgi:hypothetical protein
MGSPSVERCGARSPYRHILGRRSTWRGPGDVSPARSPAAMMETRPFMAHVPLSSCLPARSSVTSSHPSARRHRLRSPSRWARLRPCRRPRRIPDPAGPLIGPVSSTDPRRSGRPRVPTRRGRRCARRRTGQADPRVDPRRPRREECGRAHRARARDARGDDPRQPCAYAIGPSPTSLDSTDERQTSRDLDTPPCANDDARQSLEAEAAADGAGPAWRSPRTWGRAIAGPIARARRLLRHRSRAPTGDRRRGRRHLA